MVRLVLPLVLNVWTSQPGVETHECEQANAIWIVVYSINRHHTRYYDNQFNIPAQDCVIVDLWLYCAIVVCRRFHARCHCGVP